MAAAITAAEKGAHVVVLEQHPRVGKKLLSTGNGRCNLMNSCARAENFHSNSAVLLPLDKSLLSEFFEGLGLVCREEDGGRMYPASGHAGSVVDMLRARMERLGVEIRTDLTVRTLRCDRGGFAISFTEANARGDVLFADRAVIAAGGKAGISLSDADGYSLLRLLGHRITSLRPALAPVQVNPRSIRGLKGVRAHADVALHIDGEQSGIEYGEVIFSDDYISGIPVMNCARWVTPGVPAELCLNLLPERSVTDWFSWLRRRATNAPDTPAEMILRGLLHPRISLCLLRELSILPAARAIETPWSAVAGLLCRWTIPVTGAEVFHKAQVTAGGAALDQFDMNTMESRITPGLFAAGEILDVDGGCGGFNLMWAWISGIAAGRGAADAATVSR